jgi:hypothetical protein
MYKRQKGLFPIASTVLGMLILFGIFIFGLDFFINLLKEETQITTFTVITALLYVFLILFPFSLIAGFLVSLFPEIRLTSQGVRYRWGLIYDTIKWDEIENLVELKNRTVLLSIRRKGISLLRLYYQRIVGYYLKHEYPVLLLSPGLEQREMILSEIVKNSPVKDVRKVDDPYA